MLDGLLPTLNVMRKRKRPVAISVPDVDMAAGADSVVEKHTALAVYKGGKVAME